MNFTNGCLNFSVVFIESLKPFSGDMKHLKIHWVYVYH